MASQVIIHVGAPKTGTTFLQAVLFHNRQRLREQGVLVPGKTRRDHGKAARGVREGAGSKKYGEWSRLAAEARRWPGKVVITNEWFCMAPAENSRQALEDLGETEKHIIFTARDFVDQIPSAWQETLKLGVPSTLESFVKSLAADDQAESVLPDVAVMRDRWRWSVFDPAEGLDRWRADLPTECLHVVTVPPKGADPGLLWERVAVVCGIDPGSCDIEVDQVRESVGAESARLLQEIGPALRAAVAANVGYGREAFPWIRGYFANELLMRSGGRPIAMRPPEWTMIRNRSEQTIERLRLAGYHVAGDLTDLTSSRPAPGGRHPDEVTDRELLELALPLLADLLGRVRAEYLRAEEAEGRATGTSSDYRAASQPAPKPRPTQPR